MSRTHPSAALRTLYNMFVRPALRPPMRQPAPWIQHVSRIAPTQQQRALSFTPPRAASGREKRRWDEDIAARTVYLVDTANNKLSEARSKLDVLSNMDRKTHRLVQVSADEPGNRQFVPVCKIVDKRQQYQAEKEQKKRQKERKAEQAKIQSLKTIELNWAIDPNDLGHRLEKMQQFLGEGRRVEVVLAAKKRGRKATADECEGVLKRIRETVECVPGAREFKGLNGKLGGFATWVLQGQPQAQEKRQVE